MKKIHSILVVLAASALFAGCGSPTKEDVCGDCLDANIKATCESGYDACVQADCNLGDYESAIVDSGLCPEPE